MRKLWLALICLLFTSVAFSRPVVVVNPEQDEDIEFKVNDGGTIKEALNIDGATSYVKVLERLGIGTAPSVTFHTVVSGNHNISRLQGGDSNHTSIQLSNSDTSDLWGLVRDGGDSDKFKIYYNTTPGNDYFTISTDGKVEIDGAGTAASGYDLKVNSVATTDAGDNNFMTTFYNGSKMIGGFYKTHANGGILSLKKTDGTSNGVWLAGGATSYFDNNEQGVAFGDAGKDSDVPFYFNAYKSGCGYASGANYPNGTVAAFSRAATNCTAGIAQVYITGGGPYAYLYLGDHTNPSRGGIFYDTDTLHLANGGSAVRIDASKTVVVNGSNLTGGQLEVQSTGNAQLSIVSDNDNNTAQAFASIFFSDYTNAKGVIRGDYGGASEALRINPSGYGGNISLAEGGGKVGFGVNPTYLHHVEYNTSTRMAVFKNTSTSNGQILGLETNINSNSNLQQIFHIYTQRGGASSTEMYVSNNGQIYVDPDNWATGGTAIGVSSTSGGHLTTSPSSRRYKENISTENFYNEIDTSKIFDLEPVVFDYKVDGRHSFGYIAEDVYPNVPSVVYIAEQEDGSRQIESVDYRMLSVLIIEEFKKTKKENELMKSWICSQDNAPEALCVGY